MDRLNQYVVKYRRWFVWYSALLLLILGQKGLAQDARVFRVVPLGVYGGSDESNLSCYMAGVSGSNDYVCLDAWTLYAGIRRAIQRGTFQVSEPTVLRDYIKGYLISHGHLDHVAGLIINSPDDTAKPIYGLGFCLKILQDKYITWESCANFGDRGEAPRLDKYRYVSLSEGAEAPLKGTSMYIRAFELSHGNPYKSTAFLLRHDSAYLLYLGDTGADSIEKSDKLHLLWQSVVPLVRKGKLKGIFIEVSYSDAQPLNRLFGHLTPALFCEDMADLGKLAGTNAMRSPPVVITHIKPFGDNEKKIQEELEASNALRLREIFPEQGTLLEF